MKLIYYSLFIAIQKVKLFIFTKIVKIKLKIIGINSSKLKVYRGIPKLIIHPKSTLIIGDNFTINNYDNVGWFSNSYIEIKKGATLTIGKNVGISSSMIYCSSNIRIDDNVKIGGGCRIFDTNFHNMNYEYRRYPKTDGPLAISKPIHIEKDVFIGCNSFICKGVHIGERSIIAAGSVVVKSIPPDECWGGNPAKFIKKL